MGNKRIGKVLFVAFLLRAAAALIHKYLFILPAGCCDARKFEQVAWEWSQYSWDNFYLLFNPQQSYIISWFGGSIYSVFGRDPFMLQMVNVFIGVITVYVVYKIALLLMEEEYAYVVVWMYALHPTVIENSAVFLREVQVILGLSLSIYFFIKWYQKGNTPYLIYSFLFISVSAIFHGGMAVGLVIMIFVVFAIVSKRVWGLKESLEFKRGTFLTFTVLLFGIIYLFVTGLPQLSSIGDYERFLAAAEAAEAASTAASNRAEGGAAYLTGLTASNPVDLLWQAPIRALYFLFSPFPWNISSIFHLKGFIDSGFLIYIFYIMWKYRKELWVNDIYRYLLYILLIYVFVFSFGSSNFGSAIRHKAKFLPIIIMFYGLKQFGRK